MIEFERTDRGFAIGKFIDRYGYECSVQDSSLASEAAIWLGANGSVLKKCVLGQGWVNVPLPDGTSVFPERMHLTVPMVKELITVLERFVENETVGDETVHIPTKRCPHCDVERVLAEFDDGRRSLCDSCYEELL